MPETKSKHPLEIVGESARVTNGLWWLSYDGLALVDAAWMGKPVILVPTEEVRVLAVDLPIANRAQRAAALPFAIEDEMAEPLETLHTALGLELSAGRYLAGVVRHDRMAAWLVRAAEAGLGDAMLVPDALALPAPAAETWAVAARQGRVLVRTDAGPAFAVPLATFETVWTQAGCPRLSSYGDPLPASVAQDPLQDGWSAWPLLSQPTPLDLRQGVYAVQSAVTPWLRRAAMVVALGLIAHGVLLAADTFALRRSAEAKRDVVAALITGAGGPPGGDLAATAEAMLPQAGGTPSNLLPLFSRTARALQPLGTSVTLQSIAYTEDAGLTLALEASDLASLQKAETALTGVGLKPVSGGATVEGGHAREQMTVSAGAAT